MMDPLLSPTFKNPGKSCLKPYRISHNRFIPIEEEVFDVKKIFALLFILLLAACSEQGPEYDTELTTAYGVPLITSEKDTLTYGERRIEIFNNSNLPISYTATEIKFDVDYTQQDLKVWSEKNLTHITNAIFDHILDQEGLLIEPNESLVLIIDMAGHPYDVSFNLNFEVGEEEIIKHILLSQND